MTYSIKSYQESFLNDQERVGKEVTKDWKGFAQTPADQLKQIYSQPGFDPETRLYCFKDNTLIGFLPSKVEGDNREEASLEFPLVLPEHKEAESLLFERAIEVLRSKGVRAVKARGCEGWGRTLEMARRWAFTRDAELAIIFSMNVGAQKGEDISGAEDITTYSHQRDLEQMIDIFIREFNMTPEQARTNFETIAKSGEQVITHLVIRKEGKIIGRALALRDTAPGHAYMGALYVTEERQRKLFLAEILKKCRENGITRLNATIYGDALRDKEQLTRVYESLGFARVDTLYSYVKKI